MREVSGRHGKNIREVRDVMRNTSVVKRKETERNERKPRSRTTEQRRSSEGLRRGRKEGGMSILRSFVGSHIRGQARHTQKCGRGGLTKRRGMRGGRETWCNFWDRRSKVTRGWVAKWDGHSCIAQRRFDRG